MQTYLFEAVNGHEGGIRNWGKFLVGVPDQEWEWRSRTGTSLPLLLGLLGWNRGDILVLDLATGEGAVFTPGGSARADLHKRGRWVCVLFEGFLGWLYEQDLSAIDELPKLVELPHVPVDLRGYRHEHLVPHKDANDAVGDAAHTGGSVNVDVGAGLGEGSGPDTTPGEVLRAWMTDARITSAELAEGEPVLDEATVQGIIDGTVRVTLDIASALHRFTKISLSFWLDLQAEVDANCPVDTVTAPFAPAQVEALNRFQSGSGMHPFTCGTDSSHGALVATTQGWHCPVGCGYIQNWAHRFMADGSWQPTVLPPVPGPEVA